MNKKIIISFLILIVLSLSVYSETYNLNNVFDKLPDFLNTYSGSYYISDVFTYYYLGPNDNLGNWKKSIEYNQFSYKEISENVGQFKKTLLEIDKDNKINIYQKFPNAKNNENPGYILVLENKDKKNVLFYHIPEKGHDYPIRFYDAVSSKDLNNIAIVYMDYYGSFLITYLDLNKKLILTKRTPPSNSLHTFNRNFTSVRFWTNNIIRFETSDGSIECYKIFLNKDEKSSDLVVYCNNLGIEEQEQYDNLLNSEPKFNLDGFYYNESKDNLANDTFF